MASAKPGVHVVQLKPIEVPEALVNGNKFVKWDDDSQVGTPVTLKVDAKGHILYWADQSREVDCLDITTILDVRNGKYARVPKEAKLRDTLLIGEPSSSVEDKTITVAYGTDFVNTSFVNFVSIGKDIAKQWSDELFSYSRNPLAMNASYASFMEKMYTRILVCTAQDGKIPVKNFFKHFASNKDDRKRVEKALDATELPSGKGDSIQPKMFTPDKFFAFYKNLVKRQEIEKIFESTGAKHKPYHHLTVDQLVQILNKDQRDPRLNEILYPFYKPKEAQAIIDKYEPKTIADKGHITEDGFLRYLMSEENAIVDPEKLDLSEDMDQPLSHYFINSSHNTYLTGHQFTGKSSVEMYRQCLLAGCRCIELDCWDGKGADEEPIITHGFTMCSEISFKEVIEAINESAFKTSVYPVLLSFENHCGQKQQAKMATYCRTIFADSLLVNPLPSHPLQPGIPLPSPNDLKCKIIIKNKKRHTKKTKRPKSSGGPGAGPPGVKGGEGAEQDDQDEADGEDAETEKVVATGEGADSESESESDDDDIAGLTEEEEKRRLKEKKEKGTAGKEAEAGLEMSLLVNYIQPVHFHSFEISEKRAHSYEISSFVETQALALLKEYPVYFVNYNKQQLARLYPKGTRVDSSNFMPQVFWNAGCQLVALNFQILDLAMQLNLGMFEFNATCGYILKPDFMRRKDRRFDPFAESTVDGIVAGTLSVKILSGMFLSEKKSGVYVEAEMYGLPADTVRKRFKTKTVPGNAINPVFDDDKFVFKKIVLPNLAMLRLAVYEDQGNKLLGHRIMPLEGLRPGYRHIQLRNEMNQPLPLACLFVYITVGDYVPDAFADFAAALENPRAYLSAMEKHAEQLAVLTDDFAEEVDAEKGEAKEGEEGAKEGVEGSGSGPNSNRPSRGPSVKPRTNSVRSNQSSDSGDATEKKNGAFDRKFQSSMHMSLKQKESGETTAQPQSSTPAGGASVPPVNRMMSSSQGLTAENGGVAQAHVTQSKLSQPDIISPVPLDDLKESKSYQKIFRKMSKELDTLRKKHEKQTKGLKDNSGVQQEKLVIGHQKCRANLEKNHTKSIRKVQKNPSGDVAFEQKKELEKLVKEQERGVRELKRTQSQQLMQVQQDHFKDELDLYCRYHEPLYEALDQAMIVSHESQHKQLQAIHDKEVAELRKQQDAQSKEDMKELSKKHKDKSELARMKREMQQKHIQNVVAERQKYQDYLEKRKNELEKKQAEIRKEFEEERKSRIDQLKKDYESKCGQIQQKFKSDTQAQYSSDDEG